MRSEVLPPGYTFAWSGLAYAEKQAGGTSSLAFVFGLVIVFLVLAAQYESWTLPGAVMTAVPFGILGALLTNHLRGLENDVYFQIGLLVLIGLGAKNAVLRVSAAVEFRKQGKSIMEATVLAGEQRLRPIIMTSLAFAIGCLPLALAVGAGANARHSIGTGIIGGMLGETTLAMLYVPLFFYIFDRMKERGEEKRAGSGGRTRRARDPAIARAAPGGRLTWDAMIRWAPAVLAVLLLQACMVGPDYTRPTIVAPAAFIYEPKDAADTANTDWWRQFQDPVLDQLIADALANNLNVKVAAANVDQAASILTQTRSGLYPQVGYNGAAGRARSTEAGSTPELARLIPNPQSSYQALLSASWEIDLWGRIRRLSESARANLLATDEARRGVILSLVASVASNYLTLAWTRRTTGRRQGDARDLCRVGATVRTAVQVRPDLADECRAGAVAIRNRRRADSTDRIADRADRECARRPARTRPRSDSARQRHLSTRSAGGAGGRTVHAARAASGHRAGRRQPDRRQRADRRRQSALFSDHFPDRRCGQLERGIVQTCSRGRRGSGVMRGS